MNTLSRFLISCLSIFCSLAFAQIKDLSFSNKNVAIFGDAHIVSDQSAMGGVAGLFDGVGDFLQVSPAPVSGNQSLVTLEAWVYLESNDNGEWPIVSQSINAVDGDQFFSITLVNDAGEYKNRLRFHRGAGFLSAIDLVGKLSIPLHQWTHVAFDCDGSSARLFVNGALDSSENLTVGWLSSDSPFRVATNKNDFTGLNGYANGKISGLRVTQDVSRYRESFLPQTYAKIGDMSADPFLAKVVLLLQGEGGVEANRFIDSSLYPKYFSPTGNIGLSSNNYKNGNSSIFFDGSGDYLTSTYNDDFDLSQSDFTIDGWMYVTEYAGSSVYGTILSKRNSSTDLDYVLYVHGKDKNIVFSFGNSSTARINIRAPINSVALDNWYHFAVTRQGGDIKLFLNGEEVGSSTGNTKLRNRSIPLDIGKSINNTDSYFSGYLDDVRITKGVVRYSGNFTPQVPPTLPNKVGDLDWEKVSYYLYAANADLTTQISDLSNYKKAISIAGNTHTVINSSSIQRAGAIAFDGNGDYVTTTYSDDFKLDGDFTIDGWVYVNAYEGSSLYGTIFSKRSSGADFDYGLYVSGGGKNMVFSYGTSSSARTNIRSPQGSILLNQWYHFAVVKSDADINLYIDGKLMGSTSGVSQLKNRKISIEVGKSLTYSDSYFSGNIQDLRISKNLVRYQGEFTPPSSPIDPSHFFDDPYSNYVSLSILTDSCTEASECPKVLDSDISLDSNLKSNQILVTFSKPMMSSGITKSHFLITDDKGELYPIKSITAETETEFSIFPETPLGGGNYVLSVSPYMLSKLGLMLDQNGNRVTGESSDYYVKEFSVGFVDPVAVTPSVDSYGNGNGLSLGISWRDYVPVENGRAINTFRIYLSELPISTFENVQPYQQVSSSITSILIDNLKNDTAYYVGVAAIDANGKVSSPSVVMATTKATSQKSTAYSYNLAGQILEEDGPRADLNDATSYVYYDNGDLHSVTNALGQKTTYNSYDLGGRILSKTNINGVNEEYAYDENGFLKTATVKAVNESDADLITQYTYDPLGLLTKLVLANGDAIEYEYDGARRLTAIKNPNGERIEYVLDAAGNKTQEVIKNSQGASVFSSVQSFDELSRLRISQGNNNQKNLYNYDENGNLTSEKDARNSTTTSVYNELNQLAEKIDAGTGSSKFTYNSDGNITSVTDARNNQTTFDYDGLGNLLSETSPATGTTIFTYDEAGNRTSSTDARGVVANYHYDALNRLTSVEYPASPSENITYGYDATANGNLGVGHLTSIVTASVRLDFEYNYQGLISKKYTQVANSFNTTSYRYDAAGNLNGITYPSGREVSYERDSTGRINAIKTKTDAGAAEQVVVTGVSYMPFGPAKDYVYGNGLSLVNQYDLDYRLTHIDVGSVFNRDYGFDAVNNITNILDNLSSGNQVFGYDALNRLTSASGTYGSLGYTYDAVGNRLTETRNGVTDTYSYPAASNRLSSITRTQGNRDFAYDNAGNPIARTADDGSSQTLSFNNANRLDSINVNGGQTATYTYNPLGQRVVKELANGDKEIYHYDEAGQLIAVVDGAGNRLREYIYWDGKQVAMVRSGNIYYIHNDHLNTPQVITDANQQVVWMANYEPFGKLAANQTNSIEVYSRFPGQYLDSETGLYYNYFRDYDPSIGRYIESDPIGLRGGNNTYGYVLQSPVRYSDRHGLFVDATGAYLGASAAATATGTSLATVGGAVAAAGLVGYGIGKYVIYPIVEEPLARAIDQVSSWFGNDDPRDKFWQDSGLPDPDGYYSPKDELIPDPNGSGNSDKAKNCRKSCSPILEVGGPGAIDAFRKCLRDCMKDDSKQCP